MKLQLFWNLVALLLWSTVIEGILFAQGQECEWDYGKPGAVNDAVRRRMIVNGGAAEEDEYGWQVQFQKIGCGGTIIGREWILTAAHCFFPHIYNGEKTTDADLPIPVTDLEIELAHKTFSRSKAKPVDLILHENYNYRLTDHKNDIALVRIEPLDCDMLNTGQGGIQAIGLSSSRNSTSINGCTAFVTGSGATEEGGDPPTFDQLHELSTYAYTHDECNSWETPNFPIIHETHICAFTHDDSQEDACQGDSGGPMKIDTDVSTDQHKYVQVGIVSWGVGCARGLPGAYTSVAYYEDWIKKYYPDAYFESFTDCDKGNYQEGGPINWAWFMVGMFIGFLCVVGTACVLCTYYGVQNKDHILLDNAEDGW